MRPGNLFVVLAKRAVFGAVAIDGLHGPSEAVVLTDESADPLLCAADLVAQAEHDELATAVLITTGEALVSRVQETLEEQLATLERAPIIRGALERNGFIALVDDLRQGVELANLIAPEHLSVMVREPWALLGSIRHTGAIFLGAASSAVLGDYVAGPSHVMPTGGTARFSSPLRTEDFLKVTSLVALDPEAARELGVAAATLARAEGLTAHAGALEVREKQAGFTQGRKAYNDTALPRTLPMGMGKDTSWTIAKKRSRDVRQCVSRAFSAWCAPIFAWWCLMRHHPRRHPE